MPTHPQHQMSGHLQALHAKHAASKAQTDTLAAQIKQHEAMQQLQAEQMMQGQMQPGMPPGVQGQGLSPQVMQMLMGGGVQ